MEKLRISQFYKKKKSEISWNPMLHHHFHKILAAPDKPSSPILTIFKFTIPSLNKLRYSEQ